MSKEIGAEVKAPEFTGWRATLWPIHSYEMKKFAPLALIMFAVCLTIQFYVIQKILWL